MPAYLVIAPPDAEAAEYGIPAGLRARLRTRLPDPALASRRGRSPASDYNLWTDFGLNRAEFVAVLKHTLDLRRKGQPAHRCSSACTASTTRTTYTQPVPSATLADRRGAVIDFLTWALSTYPDVRVVATKAVLDWIRNPVPLR